MRGLNDSLLPYRSVILGARISAKDEACVRASIGGGDVRVYRAIASEKSGRFAMKIDPE